MLVLGLHKAMNGNCALLPAAMASNRKARAGVSVAAPRHQAGRSGRSVGQLQRHSAAQLHGLAVQQTAHSMH